MTNDEEFQAIRVSPALSTDSIMIDEINNELRTLSLLHELPDEDLELSFQPISQFHYFKMLPVEVRLRIWRATFPRRTQYLTLRGYQSLEFAHKSLLRFPVTSRVNIESRSETLKNYKVFHCLPQGLLSSPAQIYLASFSWNAKQDTLRVSNFHLRCLDKLPQWKAVVDVGKYELATFMATVRTLQITHTIWGGNLKDRQCDILRAAPLKALEELEIWDLGAKSCQARSLMQHLCIMYGGNAQQCLDFYNKEFYTGALSPPKVSIIDDKTKKVVLKT